MRLLNASTIRLESFYNEATTPSYAILSHTWGEEEVSFQDLEHVGTHLESTRASSLLRSQGFYKILKCCERALADGLQYAWVDTCCIDKTSSAELSESINSMFKWYKNAIICYAYLDDIDDSIAIRAGGTTSDSDGSSDADSQGGKSLNVSYLATARWFTRGWTLQELIAPREVIFFAHAWDVLGVKTMMLHILEQITGIDEPALREGRWDGISVAQRMSWAKKRQTTRTEDIAYCLLGIST
ncbi:HET-domain-containing protein [Karstenula rhodostoma CBS 690.94]|uniref:HET-domain-containing protein n=1 Tax=Karstenula rhodostoma CBS 690.94 TaxID=1392251 RepID=A0A9P4P8D0_9PLEO|nr:HET-domain-containing protein [Karstenula rhodostoma CBS 690.94]